MPSNIHLLLMILVGVSHASPAYKHHANHADRLFPRQGGLLPANATVSNGNLNGYEITVDGLHLCSSSMLLGMISKTGRGQNVTAGRYLQDLESISDNERIKMIAANFQDALSVLNNETCHKKRTEEQKQHDGRVTYKIWSNVAVFTTGYCASWAFSHFQGTLVPSNSAIAVGCISTIINLAHQVVEEMHHRGKMNSTDALIYSIGGRALTSMAKSAKVATQYTCPQYSQSDLEAGTLDTPAREMSNLDILSADNLNPDNSQSQSVGRYLSSFRSSVNPSIAEVENESADRLSPIASEKNSLSFDDPATPLTCQSWAVSGWGTQDNV